MSALQTSNLQLTATKCSFLAEKEVSFSRQQTCGCYQCLLTHYNKIKVKQLFGGFVTLNPFKSIIKIKGTWMDPLHKITRADNKYILTEVSNPSINWIMQFHHTPNTTKSLLLLLRPSEAIDAYLCQKVWGRPRRRWNLYPRDNFTNF